MIYILIVEDIVFQLQRLVTAISRYNEEAAKEVKGLLGLFPVEMDLKEDVFQYKQNPFHRFDSEDHELNHAQQHTVDDSAGANGDVKIIDLDN